MIAVVLRKSHPQAQRELLQLDEICVIIHRRLMVQCKFVSCAGALETGEREKEREVNERSRVETECKVIGAFLGFAISRALTAHLTLARAPSLIRIPHAELVQPQFSRDPIIFRASYETRRAPRYSVAPSACQSPPLALSALVSSTYVIVDFVLVVERVQQRVDRVRVDHIAGAAARHRGTVATTAGIVVDHAVRGRM
jgi:hypothetical protein